MVMLSKLDADAASNIRDQHDYERALALIDELFDWYRSLGGSFAGIRRIQQNGAKHRGPGEVTMKILGGFCI